MVSLATVIPIICPSTIVFMLLEILGKQLQPQGNKFCVILKYFAILTSCTCCRIWAECASGWHERFTFIDLPCRPNLNVVAVAQKKSQLHGTPRQNQLFSYIWLKTLLIPKLPSIMKSLLTF